MSFSFKIQRPPGSASTSAPPSRPQSPLSRPPDARPTARPRAWHAHDSDSDDDDANKGDELVTGFDSERGLERKHQVEKAAPLVIPSLPNRDWRKEAGQGKKKKGKEMYLPDSAGAMRMAGPGQQKTQGGLGTRDVINDSVVVGGLEMVSKKVEEEEEVKMEVDADTLTSTTTITTTTVMEVPVESEEQRALRELLQGEQVEQERQLEAITSAADVERSAAPPVDETDAFRRDLMTRPDEPSLDDYARVPVGQFGAALLRGMGAPKRNQPKEAFVPSSRPALLGIGAKPISDVLGVEKGKNGKPVRKDRREDMRFVPLMKRENTLDRQQQRQFQKRHSSRIPSTSTLLATNFAFPSAPRLERQLFVWQTTEKSRS